MAIVYSFFMGIQCNLFEELVEQLQQLAIFQTINESRVLAYLIYHPNRQSGMEISEYLEISNTKIYPALNSLVELDLVIKDETSRPYSYYLVPPEKLNQLLYDMVTEHITLKQETLANCQRLITEGWYQSNPLTTSIGGIFYDQAVVTQLQSLTIFPISRCKILLASQAISLVEVLNQILADLASRSELILAIPHSQPFIDGLNDILTSIPRNKIFQSTLKLSSYVLIDDHLLLMIHHQKIGNMCIVTDDSELIKRINRLWDDSDTVLELHRILRNE